MIGNKYWATGVRVSFSGGRWTASVDFYDDGFANQQSSEGTLRTRYFMSSMQKAIDLIIEDMKRLGIAFVSELKDRPPSIHVPTIYIPGDGEGEEAKHLPKSWKNTVRKQCERLGWYCIY